MKKKITKQNGFTLVETLLSTLILMLAFSVVVSGIPVAKRACENVMRGANAQVLLSTTITRLRGELGTASNIRAEGANRITYTNAETGASSRIYIENNTIKYQHYVAIEGIGKDSNAVPFISEEAGGGLKLTCKGISFENGLITVSGLSVSDVVSNRSDLSHRDTLLIRVITY
ncbi:MAG: type II secretion system protein [Lachnospiraceae bacterium]|nr:type II secretion system protein [Lachnospiraceae bacterium]